MSNLPSHGVHCPEECLKSKVVENLSIHYCADFATIETVFRTITSVNQLTLYEQSQKCVKNVNPAMIEQGDLLWKDNPTHRSCQV